MTNIVDRNKSDLLKFIKNGKQVPYKSFYYGD